MTDDREQPQDRAVRVRAAPARLPRRGARLALRLRARAAARRSRRWPAPPRRSRTGCRRRAGPCLGRIYRASFGGERSSPRHEVEPDVTSSAVAHELILGRYRALRPLGSGGMGHVWLARDERNGLDVSLKMVVREGRVAERAEREARAAAALRHPRCQRIYTLARDSSHVYIAYEYVPGPHAAPGARGGRALRPRTRSRPPRRCSTRSPTPTARGSSTATSSRRTCCSASRTASTSGCSTSGSPRWRSSTR